MRFPFTALLLLSLAFLLGCNQDKPRPGARTVRLNPDPQHAYQLTLTLENAPGPFAHVQGVMQFNAENGALCGYREPITAIISDPVENIPFDLTKVSDNEYSGTIYTDYLMDDNYYGRAVCHWKFTEARARLRATGDTKETRFIIDIHLDKIQNLGSESRYYWKGRYPQSFSERFIDLGSITPEEYLPEFRNDVFTISLTVKEPDNEHN
ncbi:MAG: hypothetical protein LBL59_06490 [Xanthomonadaceae bacterium]|nr:hypothetical protein [Xanthomonadaceae bacterium]